MKNFEKYIDELTDIDKVACKICKIRKFNCQTLVKGCEEIKAKNKKWLLEEYVELIQISHDEYVILKNLPKKWKWIVRHDNGENLWLFVNKPTKEGYCIWVDLEEYDDEHFDLFNHLFKFVKWEDEPYEIAKLIEDYEKENEDE